MKTTHTRWYGSQLVALFSVALVGVTVSTVFAGPRTPTQAAEELDAWTPEALKELNEIRRNAKANAFGKSNSDFFQASILSESKDQIRIVDVGDFDNDGDIDIVYAAEGDDTLGWFENNGNNPPSFTDHIISTSEDGATFVLSVDIDDDGDLDIVLCSRFSNEISLWLNDGEADPTFTKSFVGSVNNASSVAAGDFNNDGKIDLVVPNPAGNELTFFLQDPDLIISAGNSVPPAISFLRYGYFTEFGRPTSVASVNYDGFGGDDLAVACRDTGNIFLMINELDPIQFDNEKLVVISVLPEISGLLFFEEYLIDTIERPQDITFADMDNNEIPDIIVAGEKRDEILIYREDNFLFNQLSSDKGGPEFFFQKTYVTANFEASGRPNVGYADRPFFVRAADLNNDGNLDLLVPALGNNRFLWYEQISDEFIGEVLDKGRPLQGFLNPLRFHARSISRNFESPRSMVAADFNGDGLQDIVGAATQDDTIVVFRNKGFQNPHINPSIEITSPLDQAVIFNESSVDLEGNYSMYTNPDLVDIMLVIDASGSIKNQVALNKVKQTALDFLDSLPLQKISVLDSDDKFITVIPESNLSVRVGLVVFSTENVLEFPLGSDIGEMYEFISTIEPATRTNISDALLTANSELETNGLPDSHKMMLLISDGVENIKDGWLSANGIFYPIHTYSTGLPLFSLPFPDPALVEIGGGELLQDIAFVTGGKHFFGFNTPSFFSVFSPYDYLDTIFIEVDFAGASTTAPEAKSVNVPGTYFPSITDSTFEFQGLPIELTEEGIQGTSITATLVTDELLPRFYSATITVFGEINSGPTQPTFSPVLHIQLNNVPTDPDGDEIFYKYKWTSDGDDAETLIGPTSETSSILSEGPNVTFDPGETWTVEVTACDENGFTSPVFTYTFIISSPSIITLSP